MSRKRAITTFLSRKSMITRLSIASEDFLGSSIAPQVMPPCVVVLSTGPQVSLLQNTESPIPLLRHSSTIGLPLYW